ncbi:hypothetical protein [Streptomyces sp. NPDC006477]
MLRFRPAHRWAAVLLTALALLTPAIAMSGETTDSVVSTSGTENMIWG